jgi:hypothetical protein
MTRHHRRTLSRALSALLLAGATLPLAASVAGAVPSSSTNPFYLVIGASDSLGVQLAPNGHTTRRTTQGYANDVVAAEAARGVTLDMTQIGCPGESTYTMINGGDRCYSGTTTQLSTAISFLSSHRNDTGLVTLDLGFNNLLPCFANGSPDPTCIANLLPKLRLDMVTILTALKAAAGPHVTFVGLDHFNPYLASAAAGQSGHNLASTSVAKFTTLNHTLSDAYGSFGVAVAHVAAAFHLADSDLVHRHGHTVPSDALHVCTLTYMCSSHHAPNFHPDARGYQIIANAILATLTPTWPN